jgi:hypothetical protein
MVEHSLKHAGKFTRGGAFDATFLSAQGEGGLSRFEPDLSRSKAIIDDVWYSGEAVQSCECENLAGLWRRLVLNVLNQSRLNTHFEAREP